MEADEISRVPAMKDLFRRAVNSGDVDDIGNRLQLKASDLSFAGM